MSGEVGKKIRKTRSDKKRDVQPTISVDLKDCIYRVSYIVRRPVKDVAEDLCKIGLDNREVLDEISEKFRRDVRIGRVLYRGNMDLESNRGRIDEKETERITIRFTNDVHGHISALSYALDSSVARACGILLDVCIKRVDVLGVILEDELEECGRDKERLRELKRVVEYTELNELGRNGLDWMEVIRSLLNRVKPEVENKDSDKIIVNYWRDMD